MASEDNLCKYVLPHGQPYWAKLKEILERLQNVEDEDSLCQIFIDIHQEVSPELFSIHHINGLLNAGEGLKKHWEEFDLIPFMQVLGNLALEIETLFESVELPAFPANSNGSVSLTRRKVRCLNTFVFIGGLKEKQWPNFSFECDYVPLIKNTDSVSMARIQCHLSYLFETINAEFMPNEIVTYTRRLPDEFPNWANCTTGFENVEVQVFADTLIEDQPASCHIDFANKHLHIAQIIPSATQEEVVFSIRPECFPAMLLFQTMFASDTIILSNVQRYCNYTGYLHTFEYAGPFKNRTSENPVHVLAIDAIMNVGFKQFQEENVLRDLNKAYSGFDFPNYEDEWISTGMWGCGVFGGDPVLKFLQQMMAAAVTNKKLYYSCYLNERLTNQLQNLGQKLIEDELKVKDVWEIIMKFKKTGSFERYLLEKFKIGLPTISENVTETNECSIQ